MAIEQEFGNIQAFNEAQLQAHGTIYSNKDYQEEWLETRLTEYDADS